MNRFLLLSLFIASPALAQVDAKTTRAYKAKCASCHGEDGKGNTEAAKKMGGVRDLTNAEVQKKLTDDKIKEVIVKGAKEKKGDKDAEMPAFPDLQPATVDGLLKLVRSFAGK